MLTVLCDFLTELEGFRVVVLLSLELPLLVFKLV